MVELQIACLGEFQVTLAGAVLTLFHTDKNRALLPYLALEPRVHARAELAQLLWPGYSDESARSSLRQALHQLRQTLRDAEADRPWLLLTRQTVQLNPDAPIHVDVLTFRHLLATCASHAHADLTTCAPCLARLRQAVDLYRGDFLAGFTVADSPPFEEWRRVIQEQLHIQALDALTDLVTAAEAAGDDAQALHDARRLLALEPWLEAAHCQVMRLLARRGQRAEALAQYQRCRQVLAEELGVEPAAETVALYEQIRRGDRETRRQGDTRQGDKETRRQGERCSPGLLVSLSPCLPLSLSPCLPLSLSPPLPVSLSAVRDWAEMPVVDFFVERSVEVAQLTAWLLPPPAPHPEGAPVQLISILGMGGMGKTTLAALVTRTVAPSFAVVIWRSLLNAPPLGELLHNWLQALSRQSLTAPKGLPPDALDDQLRLLLTYLQRERCLLVLDNVESIFATDPSVPAGTAQPQSRAGVTRPGYEAYDHLFQRLATSEHQSCLLLTSREQPYALARVAPGRGSQSQTPSGRTRLLPLPGLDQQAGHLLLESAGLQATRAEAAQLIASYSGNPLALQIVAGAIVDFFGGDVGAFQQEAGGLFDGLRLVLDQQFARLSSLEREILVWLAIEREAITVPTLRSNFVQPRPEGTRTPSLLEALQSLQNRSLLEKRADGFTLQNVIIEYTTEYLVEQVCQEIYEIRDTRYEIRKASSADELATRNSQLATSFLNRFALLKAQAKEYVRQSQVRLIVQPLVERLMTTLGRTEVVARLPHLLDRLRAANIRTGYAGGNLLNLLVHLEANLTNLDCSQLAVWQADLQGVMFAAVNFTGADLTNTAFMANIDTSKVKFLPSGELLLAEISKGELCLWRIVDGQLSAAFRRTTNSRPPVTLSDDGNWIAVVDMDYAIQIWSTAQGVCIQTLTGRRSAIRSLILSKDGTQLASSRADGVINLWDWRSGQMRQQLSGHKLDGNVLVFSADGNTLATGSSDGMIRLWDTQSQAIAGRLLATLPAHNHAVGALAFSPDGRWLASGGPSDNIRLWDLQSEGIPSRLLQGHTNIIRHLCFQPFDSTGSPTGATGSPIDAYLLASSGTDCAVRLWSLAGELRYTLLGHTDDIANLDFSADGRQLASSGTDQTIYWWDTRTGQIINSLHAYRYIPTSTVRFSPDGELAISGSEDQLVRLWPVMPRATAASPAESTSCAILRGHTGFVRAVAISPGGQMIASGSADHTIRLWDRTTHSELQRLTGHSGTILCLAFTRASGAETLLASASGDHSIRLWLINEAERAVNPRPRLLLGHGAEVLTLTFDRTGRTVASGDMNGNVCIWDVERGVIRLRLPGHTDAVTMATISADGRTLATSAFDQTVRLWDLQSGDCIQVKQDEHVGTRAVVFLRQPGTDDEVLAYAGDDFAIYLWPWRTGGRAYPLYGHSDALVGLDASPTAPILASISRDGTLRLWDLVTRTCQQIFRAPGPYTDMKITGVTGISETQKAALRALGAGAE